LQEESIRILYQWRLRQYFLNTPTKNEVDEVWQNIKECIEKAAQATIGKKNKFRSRKGLRIWNEEIEKTIEEKRKSLQTMATTKY
jgi:uncharacterized protein (UPF0210 family)